MAKQQVQLFAQARGVMVDTAATVGATVGLDLKLQDGTVVTEDMLGGGTPQFTNTFWRLIVDVPANVQALADQDGFGFFVLDGSGGSVVRMLEGVAGEITVTDASGVAANPQIGLEDVANAAGGTLQLTAFDAKGRATSHNPADTDDLPEGSSNLWFTEPRVRATPLTGLSIPSPSGILATDTVLQAFGKLQAQVAAKLDKQNPVAFGSLILADGPVGNETDSGLAFSHTGITVNPGSGVSVATFDISAPVGVTSFTLTVNGTPVLTDAPADGSTYGRKDNAWVVVTGGGGGGGTVTSVDGSGGTTGLTLTGGPITGSGTLTLGGTLALTNGGTGATTAAAARTSLGLVIGTDVQAYSANLTAWSALATSAKANSGAIGSSGLTMNTARLLGRTTGGAGAVEEITVSTGLSLASGVLTGTGGTVTSVAASGGTTGLTFSGSPITAAGTFTLGGTLAVANGGTGATSAATAPWVQKSGDTMTGMLSFSGNLNQIRMLNGTYDRLWIVSSGGDTGVFDQVAADWAWRSAINGDFYARGNVYARTGQFFGTNGGAVLSTQASGGAVYLRPNGTTTGQAVLDTSGNLTLAGAIISAGGTMSATLNFSGNINQISMVNGTYTRLWITTSAGECGIFDQNAGDWGIRYTAAGDVYGRGNVYARGNWHFGGASEANLATTAASGTINLRPNGVSTTGQLSLNSSGNATAVLFTSTSDERLKWDVREHAARPIGRLAKLWNFAWRDPLLAGRRGLSEMAQRVQKYAPEWVEAANDDIGTLSLNLPGMALEGVIYAQAQVDAQAAEIHRLRTRLENIERHLQRAA